MSLRAITPSVEETLAILADRIRHLESEDKWQFGMIRNADHFAVGSDTGGIQQAINSLGAAGGAVYMGKNDIQTTVTIQAISNLLLFAGGNGIRITNTTGGDVLLVGTGTTNVILENFQVSTGGVGAGHGIVFRDFSYGHSVRSVLAEECGGDGFRAESAFIIDYIGCKAKSCGGNGFSAVNRVGGPWHPSQIRHFGSVALYNGGNGFYSDELNDPKVAACDMLLLDGCTGSENALDGLHAWGGCALNIRNASSFEANGAWGVHVDSAYGPIIDGNYLGSNVAGGIDLDNCLNFDLRPNSFRGIGMTIDIDAASIGQVHPQDPGPGVITVNYGGVASYIKADLNRIRIPACSMGAVGGVPYQQGVAYRWGAYTLRANEDDRIGVLCAPLVTGRTVTVKVCWTAIAAAPAGNVKLDLILSDVAEGASLAVSDVTDTATEAIPAQYIKRVTTFTNTLGSLGSQSLGVAIERNGTHGNDTSDDDIQILWVDLIFS